MNKTIKNNRSWLLVLISLMFIVSPTIAGGPKSHRSGNPRPRRAAHINRGYNRNIHRGYSRNIHRRHNRNTHNGYNYGIYGGYNYGLYGGGYYSPNRPYLGNVGSQTHRIIVIVQSAPKQTQKRVVQPRPKLKIIRNPFATKANKNKPRRLTTRAKIIAESKAKAKARSYVYKKDERK